MVECQDRYCEAAHGGGDFCKQKVYQKLAMLFSEYCVASADSDRKPFSKASIDEICKTYFKDVLQLDLERSKVDKLRFNGAYQFIDTDDLEKHTVTFCVTIEPSFLFPFKMKMRGDFSKYRRLRDSIGAFIYNALREEYLKRPVGGTSRRGEKGAMEGGPYLC